MSFDPEQFPLADFGFTCKGCGYPLANFSAFACPECGLAFELDQYIPDGAMPLLYADGERVRPTQAVRDLFERHGLPYCQTSQDTWGVLPGVTAGSHGGGSVAVPRDRYLEAIDLLRRAKLGEPMPPPAPPPQAPSSDWTCAACGEENPPTFDLCWQCGQCRP